MGTWLLMVEDWVHAEEARPDRTKPPAAVAARAIVPYVAAGGVGRTSYRVQLPRRGAYRFGPLRISTRFPLGLVKAAARQRQAERLVVLPQLGRLSPGWTRLLDPTRLGRYQTSHRQGPIDGDYYGLREWRPGDSRRWIHWRTTAKLGKLAVRQFEQQQNRDLAVVLDLWRPDPATPETLGRVEVAVSLAATLVEELCRRGGSRLLLGVAADEGGRWSATANPLFARQLLERLALVRGSAENGLADTLRGAVEQLQPNVQIVVVSTRPNVLNAISGTEVFVGKTRQRRALSRVTWLDVGAPQLASLFHLEHAPMNVERLVQLHVLALSAIGALLLGMGQDGPLLPLLVVFAAVTSLIFTDRLNWFRLHWGVANVALLIAFLSLSDFFDLDTRGQLLAIAKLLTYMQIVQFYQRKSPRLYWHLLLLSLLQVVVAAALTTRFEFGVLLVLYAIVAISTLVFFFAHRELLRAAGVTTGFPWRRQRRRAPAASAARAGLSGQQFLDPTPVVTLAATEGPSLRWRRAASSSRSPRLPVPH